MEEDVKTKVAYRILGSKDPYRLAEQIELLIADGWWTHGTLVAVPVLQVGVGSSSIKFFQAMTKETRDE